MTRYKDCNWALPEAGCEDWTQVNVTLLMDIRDELKKLNTLLHCPNFRDIPSELRAIKRNTTKKKKVNAKT